MIVLDEGQLHSCDSCNQLVLDFSSKDAIEQIFEIKDTIRKRYPGLVQTDLPPWLRWTTDQHCTSRVERARRSFISLKRLTKLSCTNLCTAKPPMSAELQISQAALRFCGRVVSVLPFEALVSGARQSCILLDIVARKVLLLQKERGLGVSDFVLVSARQAHGMIDFSVLNFPSGGYSLNDTVLPTSTLVSMYATATKGTVNLSLLLCYSPKDLTHLVGRRPASLRSSRRLRCAQRAIAEMYGTRAPSTIAKQLIDNLAHSFIRNRPINEQPASDESFAEAKAWLQDCVDNHEICRVGKTSFVPKRLIHISREGQRWHYRMRPDEECDYVPYAALSYCWGNARDVLLRQSVYAAHYKELDPKHLPHGLADAMHVAFHIGIEFIWIDSICIHQHKPDDVAVQLPDMPRIYSNAVVTISANSAKSANQGFLHDRSTPIKGCGKNLSNAFLLPVRSDDVENLGCVTLCEDVPDGGPAPLHTRGWALQEWLLSSRSIQYWSTQTRFSCRGRCGDHYDGGSIHPPVKSQQSSGIYGEFAQLVRNFFRQSSLRRDVLLGDVRDSHTVLQKEHALWHRLVSVYSERHITKYTDKLPAIAALAQSFQLALQADYVAGLWLSDSKIVPELIWQTDQSTLHSRPDCHRDCCQQKRHLRCRESVCLAPSWSWASVSVPVMFPNCCKKANTAPKAHRKLQILQCSSVLSNPDFAYGQVQGGCLRVLAPVAEAVWSPATDIYSNCQRESLRLKGSGQVLASSFYVDALEPELNPDIITRFSNSVDVHLAILTADCSHKQYALVLRKLEDGSMKRIGLCRLHPCDAVSFGSALTYEDYIKPGGEYAEERAWIDGAPVQELTIV